MSPPTIEERVGKLERELHDSKAHARRSVDEGRLANEQALAAIVVSTQMSETRDAALKEDLGVVKKELHELRTFVRSSSKGIDLELARQSADIKEIGKSTSKLDGWFPYFKLVIQAITAIGVAYTAAHTAANHQPPEPTPAVAPAHT